MTLSITDIQLKQLLDQTAKSAAEAATAAAEEQFKKFLKDNGISIDTTTASDEENMMEAMRVNLDRQDNPKVGIFWYQQVAKRLFGVIAIDKDSIKKPNVGGGLITCYELHKDVWKKRFREQKYKNNGVGPYVGDYKDHARGRVFYNPSTDTYQIGVGSWINDCPEAKEMIIEEFNLQNQKYEFKIIIHWEIGMGWENQ